MCASGVVRIRLSKKKHLTSKALFIASRACQKRMVQRSTIPSEASVQWLSEPVAFYRTEIGQYDADASELRVEI